MLHFCSNISNRFSLITSGDVLVLTCSTSGDREAKLVVIVSRVACVTVETEMSHL